MTPGNRISSQTNQKKVKKLMSNRVLTTLAALAALAAAPAAAQEYSFQVAHTNAADEVQDMGLQKMKDLLEAKTDGAATLEIFAGGQLGDEQQTVEGVMLGSLDIGMTSNAMLSNYVDDYKVFDLPFLFPSIPSLGEKVDANFDMMEDSANGAGFQLLAVFSSGIRHLMTSEPVETIADLEGMKIRTPNNIMQIRAIEAMGGTPTPMPLGDVYPALTQGVIDGVENPLPVLFGQKLHEQAKELSMISYLQNTSLWLGGQAYFDTLDPKVVEMLHETGYEAGLYSQELAAEADEQILADMEAAGVTVTYPDIAPFKEKAMAVYDQFPEWSDGLYEEIQEQLGQ